MSHLYCYIWTGIKVGQYGIPALLRLLENHSGTSYQRKIILVCFTGHFVRFRQLVADVCIDQWPK